MTMVFAALVSTKMKSVNMMKTVNTKITFKLDNPDDIWPPTFIRMFLITALEIFIVLFVAWDSRLNMTVLAANLGLGLLIWTDQRKQLNFYAQLLLFILVLALHLYTFTQYVNDGGIAAGQLLLFGMGMAIASTF